MVASGVWKIIKVETNNTDIKFRCCEEAFSSVKLNLHLRRLSRYYVVYMLLPLYALVLAFALTFHLDIGQRASYGLTILLCITVYLLVISEKLPEKSDEYPFLGISFIVDFCILAAFLPLAEWTAHLSQRSTAKPSIFLVKLMYCCCKWYKPKKMEILDKRLKIETKRGSSMILNPNMELNEIKNEEKKEVECYSEEWRCIARLLDAIFTFIFLILQLILLVIYLVVGYVNNI